MAIATTIPSRAAVEPARDWSFWTSWDSEDFYKAQQSAEEKCRAEREHSRSCTVKVSMKGGCVALVEGFWSQPLVGTSPDSPKKLHHAGFIATSTFGHRVVEDAMTDCQSGMTAGYSEPPAYRCSPIIRFCSGEHRK